MRIDPVGQPGWQPERYPLIPNFQWFVTEMIYINWAYVGC